MNLTSKLIKALPMQSGTSKNGEWRKQDIIVKTEGQYPKKICISIWGDKIDESILKEGNMLDISFDIESREFNDKWYTDVKAWKIELLGEGTSKNTIADLPDTDELDEEGWGLPF